MNRQTYSLALCVFVAIFAFTFVAWAQDAPAAPDSQTPVPAPKAPANTPPKPKTALQKETDKLATTIPDYKNTLNNSMTPSGAGGAATNPATPTTPSTTPTPAVPELPPSRLYQPVTPTTTATKEHIEQILGRYSPGATDYTRSQSSYELFQNQLRKRQVEQGLNVKLGNIATSNPGLYQQQMTQDVSTVLQDRIGVSGTPDASLPTLMNIDRNVNPAPTTFPEKARQYVAPVGGAVTPSTGFTGSNATLDRIARINASLGNAPDLQRFQGLQNFTSRTYAGYGSYLSREYGVSGTSQAYTVPRAYDYSQMNRDIQYLKDSYGITVDPNRVTYSDLWKLRTSGVR